MLPVLPTVPFFLATVFCFANSSEKLHTWFLGTELYQKHLDSFVKKKGMTTQTKAGILTSVTLLMAVGFFLMLRKALYIPCTILAIVWLCHLVYFLFGVKTIKTECEEQICGRATGMLRRLCRFFEREGGKIMLFRGAAGRRSSSRSRRR